MWHAWRKSPPSKFIISWATQEICSILWTKKFQEHLPLASCLWARWSQSSYSHLISLGFFLILSTYLRAGYTELSFLQVFPQNRVYLASETATELLSLGQMKPINLLSSHIFKIRFNIIHLFTRRLYRVVVPAGFPAKPCEYGVWNSCGITEREQKAATNTDELPTRGCLLKGRLFKQRLVGGFWCERHKQAVGEISRNLYD